MQRQVAIRFGLSLLSAVLLFLAVPTFGLWPLMWAALVPQLWVALEAPTPRRAFLYGWLTGSVAHAVAFYWMTGLLEKFGHMPAWEALPIVGLLVVYQGLAFGLFSWGVRRLRDRPALTGWPLAVLAPLVMVAVELVVPQMFPYYLAISVAFVPSLIQIADITGPVGVTALLVAASGALLDAYRARQRGWRVAGRSAAVVTALVVLDVGYGALRIHQVDARRAAAPKVKTGIVQANIGILEKWEPSEFARLLSAHQRESATLARAGAELLVWPESSYPYALPRAPQAFARDFPIDDQRRVRRGFDTPILFGAVTVNPLGQKGSQRRDRYPYNTALMMNGAGDITGSYDKVFLMLFGEYIPFYDAIPWFTDLFPEASNFNRGSEPASFPLDIPRLGHSYRLGPLICYEDILPSFARRVAKLDPNAFINITNDAWFGRTAEPYQHLALAVFRSVEHRLEMVRAVNTGVSAHIDAAGRVVAATESVDPAVLPPPEPKTLLIDLAMLPGGGLYRHIGELFGLLSLAGLAALILWRGPQSSTAGGRTRKKSRRGSV